MGSWSAKQCQESGARMRKTIPITMTACRRYSRLPLTNDPQEGTKRCCHKVQNQLMKSLHNEIEQCTCGM